MGTHQCTLRALLVLVALWLLPACAEQPTSQTPESVHAAWVEALRANDRATLLALAVDSELKTVTVDGYLQRMQDFVQHGYVAAGVSGGAFQGIDVLPLEEAGQGKTGLSRWRFAQTEVCFAAALTPTDGGWKVQSWGQRLQCPGG